MPEMCTLKDWKREYVMRYDCGGASDYLNKLCDETKTYYTLLVNYGSPIEAWRAKKAEGKDCRQILPPRDYNEVISGWRRGEELTREYCNKDDYCYWVKWPAYLINTGRKYLADYIYIFEWRIDVEKAKKTVLFKCPDLPILSQICSALNIPKEITYYDVINAVEELVATGSVYIHGKVTNLNAVVVKKWKLEYPDRVVLIYFLKRKKEAETAEIRPQIAQAAAIIIAIAGIAAGVIIARLLTVWESYRAQGKIAEAHKAAAELAKTCLEKGYSPEECSKFVGEVSKKTEEVYVKLRPYLQTPSMSFTDFLDKYKWYIVAGFAGLVSLAILLRR